MRRGSSVGITLRKYTPADLEVILPLARRALARPEEQLGRPLWRSLDDAHGDLEGWHDIEDTLFVMEDEGEPVAFGGLVRDTLLNLFGPLVVPHCRGRQLPDRLLDATTSLAREKGIDWMTAGAGRRNHWAKRLLERSGFRSRERPTAVFRLRPRAYGLVTKRLSGLELRPGSPDDLEAVFSLYRESFPDGTRLKRRWRRWLELGEVQVAERSGALVGFVRIDAAWLTHVGVTQSERGSGIGELLIRRGLETHWQARPGRELRLTVEIDNVPAIRLYRRLGFAPWLILDVFDLELDRAD